MKIKNILLKIDKTGEYTLRQTLFKGYSYIDTPGNYVEEKKDYSSIFEYYTQNMGKNEYMKLLNFIKNHPKQVKLFMSTH